MDSADLRAVRRGALIAGVVWLLLSVEVVLVNVVFPSRDDNDGFQVLASYTCIFAALLLVGLLAARDGASRKGWILAGLLAGMAIGALTAATFAVVDNVWLDVVSRQQTKIDGFARSGVGSMREYINNGLVGTAVALTLGLGIFGGALSLTGGLVTGRPPSTAPTETPSS
jgi:hypothetical protein